MTYLLDEMLTTYEEIGDARVLYRQARAMKKAGEEGIDQDFVNAALDDYEHLVRWFAYLRISAEVQVHAAQLGDVEPGPSVVATRAHLAQAKERVE